jgi:hypothetical protein
MITDTISINVSGTDGARIQGSSQEAGVTQTQIDTVIPASTTNQLVSIAWTVADTQAVMILATSNCTLKTNSTGSPDDTINLKAGIPLVWRASASYFSNPFTVDVTAWYITTTAAARVQAAVLTT